MKRGRRVPLLAARQLEVLRDEFPGWRIRRPPSGGWIAARAGGPVVVRGTAFELRGELRRVDGAGS